MNPQSVLIPIDNQKIFIDNGVRKGRIYFSPTFKSWVVEGHPDVNLIAVSPPFKEGEKFPNNGKTISNINIKDGSWELSFSEFD